MPFEAVFGARFRICARPPHTSYGGAWQLPSRTRDRAQPSPVASNMPVSTFFRTRSHVKCWPFIAM